MRKSLETYFAVALAICKEALDAAYTNTDRGEAHMAIMHFEGASNFAHTKVQEIMDDYKTHRISAHEARGLLDDFYGIIIPSSCMIRKLSGSEDSPRHTLKKLINKASTRLPARWAIR